MADLPLDEFVKGLKGVGEVPDFQGTNSPPAFSEGQGMATPQQLPGGFDLAPLTQQETQVQARRLEQLRTRQANRAQGNQTMDMAAKLGARRGVPMDTESGLPFFLRQRVETQPTPEEKIAVLSKALPGSNPRVNDFGGLVVTLKDKQGKERDVLVNPIGMDLTDLSALTANAPEIMGSIAGIAIPAALSGGATLGPGVINAIINLGMSVGVSQAAGAAKDVGNRLMEDQPIQMEEIARRRGKEAIIEGGVAAGLGAAGKVAGTLVSPLSKRGAAQFDALAAQRYFERKYGEHVDLSIAEATGGPILQKVEASAAQLPDRPRPLIGLWRNGLTW
jgi:hypothetical protein